MIFSRAIVAGLVVAASCSSAGLAEEGAAVEMGRELVVTYCADCHATGATGDSPFPPAPPFRDLHDRYEVAFLEEALVEGLVTGHPDMPEFEFDPEHAAAIIAYLQSLE